MYYIFCNSDFKNAVNEIPLTSAKKMYSVSNPNCKVQYYEIWELSNSDYTTISEAYIDEDDSHNLDDTYLIWDESWGWWLWCDGSNIELSPTHTFTINGNNIELYYDEMAIKDYANSILEDPNDEDYWPIDNIEEIPESIKEDYFTEYGRFNDIFDYCGEVWGVSKEKNRAAIIVANAKLNNLPIYEFMLKVVG